MSIDYKELNEQVEQKVNRQRKWAKGVFFGVSVGLTLLFNGLAWVMVGSNPELRNLPPEAGAAVGGALAFLTVASGMGILYHGLSLLMDSKAALKQMRGRVVAQEFSEQLLQQGLAQQGLAQQDDQKAKRLSVSDDQPVTVSDDGELVPLEEYEQQQAKRASRGG
jgi:hypothetical protein